jgi:hypothetical protein
VSSNTNTEMCVNDGSHIRPHQRATSLLKACAVLAAASLMTTMAWASAPKVWRCDMAGHITYADQPCDKVLPAPRSAAAVQRSVDAADSRTAQQRRDAQAVARADEALARKLQQERRLRELRRPRPAAASIIGLPPDPLAQPAIRKASLEARPTRQQQPQASRQ